MKEGEEVQLYLTKPKDNGKKFFKIISGAKEISKEDFFENKAEI